MFPGRKRVALLLTGLAAGACDCSPKLVGITSTTLTIVSPGNGAAYAAGQSFDFSAIAENPGGLKDLTLYAGAETKNACTAAADCPAGYSCDLELLCIPRALRACPAQTISSTGIACDFGFIVNDNRAVIDGSQITLTAMARDKRLQVTKKTITVNVQPLVIKFTQPALTPGTSPPVADVAGTSPVAVDVVSAIPVASVQITWDGAQMLAQWENPPPGTMYQQMIAWANTMGSGRHHLLATATDTAGNTDTATLDVLVIGPDIRFTEPVIAAGTMPPMAEVAGSSPVAVLVVSPLPLADVAITYDNGSALADWPSPTGNMFSKPIAWASVMGSGLHQLTAVATTTDGETAKATLEVKVGVPEIQFTAPMIAVGSSPPVADVNAPSDVAVTVTTPVPLSISSIVITADTNTMLAQWNMNPLGTMFSKNIAWMTVLGVGLHQLIAVVTDNDGETGTAELAVQVGCRTDGDCSGNQRCCTNDGTCNPTVGVGANCDCDHPCQASDGCFPGVCGATPQQCRPGCTPGSSSPPPYGTAPQHCAPQGGLPAYCNPLPRSQVTPQNHGGACAVGDNCDVVRQNCPNMPLDRSQPAGPNNPDVPYNCVPLSPTVNGCVPAGNLGDGAINCYGDVTPGAADTVCGHSTRNCAKGFECVTLVDQFGDPESPPTCSQLCEPATSDDCDYTGCPYGSYCDQVYGQGMVYFTSGACQVSQDPFCF